MNKRADIPVTILVIGVVGVCILAILSFNFSLGSGRTGLVGPSMIKNVISTSERISFYQSKGINFDSLKRDVSYPDPTQNYIRKNSDGSYSIRSEMRDSKGLNFAVEYTFNP